MSFRAGQQGFLGSDHNFEQAEGGANLGSDPNNPGSFNPFMPLPVASNCVAGIDALLFVFILAPLSPPALSRPAGRERELIPYLVAYINKGSTRATVR